MTEYEIDIDDFLNDEHDEFDDEEDYDNKGSWKEEKFRTIQQIVIEINRDHGKELEILSNLTEREVTEFKNCSKVVAALRDVRGTTAYPIIAAFIQGLHAR